MSNGLPKVLVVDDEPAMCGFLSTALASVTDQVHTADSAQTALRALDRDQYDVVVSDFSMAGATGLDLLAASQRRLAHLAFILIAGQVGAQQLIQALWLRASDFLLKPFSVAQLYSTVLGAYERLRARQPGAHKAFSPDAGLPGVFDPAREPLRSLLAEGDKAIELLLAVLGAREPGTYAHSFRVTAYTRHLAGLIGYPPGLMAQLEQAALLHDIGKISVPDHILLKADELSEDEWDEMRRHVDLGAEMLERVPLLRPVANIVRHHHERFDGSGYPAGLAGDAIPLGSRLFAFADTLDAMTVDRPYRKASDYDSVRREIERCAGAQFDPRIATRFLEVTDETWESIRRRAEEESGIAASAAAITES